MDFFDFFYPEQAQAKYLRHIANRQAQTPLSASSARNTDEISALREDVKFLSLVVTAILKRLAETKTMSLADVQDLLTEIDGLDGVADGGLELGVLRGLLGALKQVNTAEPDNDEFRIVVQKTDRFRGG